MKIYCPNLGNAFSTLQVCNKGLITIIYILTDVSTRASILSSHFKIFLLSPSLVLCYLNSFSIFILLNSTLSFIIFTFFQVISLKLTNQKLHCMEINLYNKCPVPL